jgi:hypothetical protein
MITNLFVRRVKPKKLQRPIFYNESGANSQFRRCEVFN